MKLSRCLLVVALSSFLTGSGASVARSQTPRPSDSERPTPADPRAADATDAASPDAAAEAKGHRVLVQGKGRLAVVGASGEIEWEMPWRDIHDIWVLENGHYLVQNSMQKVAEIDPETKRVVWEYDASTRPENQDRRIEIHAFQPLEKGRVMVVESGSARILELDREGKIEKEIPLRVKNPHPHTDTRLARKLESGHYLVCHEGDGVVREYDAKGAVCWEFEVPLFGEKPRGGHGPEAFGNKCFAAVRLKSGNTLITTGNGHSVIEVSPEKKVVWKLGQDELPGIRLAWVTTLEVLPNGNYVIGNCHAGPGQPLLVEIEPRTKKVVWTFDEFERFGNSVPNTQLLDLAGRTIR